MMTRINEEDKEGFNKGKWRTLSWNRSVPPRYSGTFTDCLIALNSLLVSRGTVCLTRFLNIFWLKVGTFPWHVAA